MTEEQRKLALDLCDRILQTAARLQADLKTAAAVIEDEIERACPPPAIREEAS